MPGVTTKSGGGGGHIGVSRRRSDRLGKRVDLEPQCRGLEGGTRLDIGAIQEDPDVRGDLLERGTATADRHCLGHDRIDIDAPADIAVGDLSGHVAGPEGEGPGAHRVVRGPQAGRSFGRRETGQVERSEVDAWDDATGVRGFVGCQRTGRDCQDREHAERECDGEPERRSATTRRSGSRVRCGVGHIDCRSGILDCRGGHFNGAINGSRDGGVNGAVSLSLVGCNDFFHALCHPHDVADLGGCAPGPPGAWG